MPHLISPHGGDGLRPLLIEASEREARRAAAASLVQVPMSSRETSDLILMGMGAYTPLTGFMGEADWRGVAGDMKMVDGTFWPIPITLSVTGDLAETIGDGDDVALVDGETGTVMGTMAVSERYKPDHAFENANVFRTGDPAHPGVEKVLGQPPVNLGGTVTVFDEGPFRARYPDLCVYPHESRALFEELGWTRVAAFNTRNPMHRSHEHLVKIAIEVTDGVFIHQVLGKLKPGDIPAEIRVKAIDAMISHYFAGGTAIQAGVPLEMRYAGPREALLHAVVRQNYGCSHLIVGRDHAGVGSYYGPFDAQKIFDTLWEGAIEIHPLKIDITFFCTACGGMATARSCPHGDERKIQISGTRQREMLAGGEDIPPEFSRPEVVAILREFYANQN